MKPVIGLSCSTLVLPGMRGVPRFALVHSYIDCVTTAGGLPMMFPNVDPQLAPSYLPRIDGLVLSGGLDIDPYLYEEEPHPQLGKVDTLRDNFEMELARRAYEMGMPILAICRGIQVLNVALGGSLFQDIPSVVKDPVRHEQITIQQDALGHTVLIEGDTRLREIAGGDKVRVNSFHHQSVDELAPGFRVTARATDGVVEGIEDPQHPFCVGVQWHPERVQADPVTRGLFGALVEAARAAASAGATT